MSQCSFLILFWLIYNGLRLSVLAMIDAPGVISITWNTFGSNSIIDKKQFSIISIQNIAR